MYQSILTSEEMLDMRYNSSGVKIRGGVWVCSTLGFSSSVDGDFSYRIWYTRQIFLENTSIRGARDEGCSFLSITTHSDLDASRSLSQIRH